MDKDIIYFNSDFCLLILGEIILAYKTLCYPNLCHYYHKGLPISGLMARSPHAKLLTAASMPT